MSSPWLGIPLDDYEGHMSAAEVGQLSVLAGLFELVLNTVHPASVAVVGVAGGNGLDRIDPAVTSRVVGIDINQEYLDAARSRYGASLPGLELRQCDLSQPGATCIEPVALVHAALIFEHAGMGAAFDHAVSLVAPGGVMSVVLQLPSVSEAGVAATRFTSLQTLKDRFAMIAPETLRRELKSRGFLLDSEHEQALPGGKSFWLGVFRAEPREHTAGPAKARK